MMMTKRLVYSRKAAAWLVILCLLLSGAAWLLLTPAYALPEGARTLVLAALERQRQVEQAIQAEYRGGQYTFTSPLVIQDPYGAAPLTALVIFDTPDAAQISIHVPGSTPEAAVDAVIAGYRQHHEIAVYGLYAGTANQVMLGAETEDGQSRQTVIELQTEPLPVYLDTMQVLAVDRQRYSPGFNFSFLRNKTIYDIDGAVRWYTTHALHNVYAPLRNGRYLYTYDIEGQFSDDNLRYPLLMEKDLLGRIYAVYYVSDGIHHDVYELPGGNLLVTTNDRLSQAIEDVVVEIDRRSGHEARRLDFKDYLDPSRPNEIGFADKDWLHLNSVVYDSDDQSIIISSRAQSAVVKFSYPRMEIQWILGPHDNWSEAFQPYLLEPLGEDFEWSWSQHHATVYEESASGLDQILLFDNGVYRSFEQSGAYSAGESYSRVVHYLVDGDARTVSQVWAYGKERGSALFSESRGSAYHLANGNVLGAWAGIIKDAQGQEALALTSGGHIETRVIEVDPAASAVVFESSIAGQSSYRMIRAGLYDGYAEAGGIIGAAVNDTSANDLIDRLQYLGRDARYRLDQVWLSIKRFGRKILRTYPKIVLCVNFAGYAKMNTQAIFLG